MRRSQFLRAVAMLGLAACLPGQSGAEASDLHLVQWSDIHWGSDFDAPAAWHAALACGLKENTDLWAFTGDHGDNGVGAGDFAQRTREFWGITQKHMIDRPFVITLGNSDFRQNYQTDPDNLQETEKLYRDIWGDRYYLDALGNGVKRHCGLDWISLNTQIFSYKNRYLQAKLQAQQTFAWLVQCLKAAKGGCVLLLHIPPTVDLYTGQLAWRPEMLNKFIDIVQAHPGPVTIVSGHFHRNEVHAIQRPQGEACIFVAGSLSKKYQYCPNWRSYKCKFSGNGQLLKAEYALMYPGYPQFSSCYRIGRPEDFLTQVDRTAYLNDVFAHHPQVEDRWKELCEQFWAY